MAGRIYITGDCHSDFRKFNKTYFPEQADLDKEDYLIICGDFGGVWNVGWENKNEKYWLDWLDKKPYTTLFVDGNHENFDRLNGFQITQWHGGKVHKLRPSVIHLMRGQIFDIAGKKFFTMGGAKSHDIDGGILDTEDEEFRLKKKILDEIHALYRINHLTWWKEELPDDSEYDEASRNMEKHDFKVDYIVTHCCASSTQDEIDINANYETDSLTDFFDLVKSRCKYKKWYFGHYHKDEFINDKEVLLYDRIVRLGDSWWEEEIRMVTKNTRQKEK